MGRMWLCDGTSISIGASNRGRLRHGRALPVQGEGYVVPSLWRERQALWGTDELVEAIERASKRVRREYPGGILGVGDLSRRVGGESQLHRSHENGRDADLIYYAVDQRNRPLPPANAMPCYAASDLCSKPPRPTPGVKFGSFSPRRFDVPRNWALVRALITDPHIELQYLFCNEGLKTRMLEWARSIGEDRALLERASELLHQPGDSLPHDDHLHVRIYCAPADRLYGCQDSGIIRAWLKAEEEMLISRGIDLRLVFKRTLANLFPGMRRVIP